MPYQRPVHTVDPRGVARPVGQELIPYEPPTQRPSATGQAAQPQPQGGSAQPPKRGIFKRAAGAAGRGARFAGRGVGAVARFAANPYVLGAYAATRSTPISETSFLEPGTQRPELMGDFAYNLPEQRPGAINMDAGVVPGNLPVGDDYVPVATQRLVDMPDLEAAQRRGTRTDPRVYESSRNFPGAWESGVEGIGVRPGADSALEFFDRGGFQSPIRAGEINVMPAQAMMNMGVPNNRDAIRAAAARGDWDALERIGAISPRGPRAGGGGFAMPQGPDMIARSDALMERANDLYNRADRARSLTERSRYLKQARAMMGMAEGAQGQTANIYGTQGSLAQAMAAAQAGGDPTKAILNIAQAQKAMAEAQATEFGMGRPTAQDITALGQFAGEPGQQFAENVASERLLESYAPAVQQMTQVAGGFEELLAMLSGGAFADDPSMENAIRMMAMRSEVAMPQQPGWRDRVLSAFQPEGYAEGGYIDSDPMMSAMGGYGMEDTLGPMGALGMAGGIGMPDPLQIEYTQYAQGAERLGIPAIPFEQFVQMKQMQIPQAPQAPDMTQPMGAMGFAAGGFVDDDLAFQPRKSMIAMARGGQVPVGGKMVMDPDPNAPTDSIPAMIDGQEPAALDSGEFVIPKHAVMFHGIDKLNKLIAQAEKVPEDGAHA